MFHSFDLKVAQRSRTFARRTCVRTGECASASGTPTTATVRLVTEAKAANKVSSGGEGEEGGGGGEGRGVGEVLLRLPFASNELQ